MHRYGYTLTEHDADRPWIIISIEHRTVELEGSVDFFTWARGEWPDQRFSIQLDPWALSNPE